MKIGCCVNMIAQDAAGTGIECIETLARLGYDYVELPMAQMMSLDDENFARLVETVEKSGIRCESSNNFFPASLRITGNEPTGRDEMEAYITKALDRATRLGVKSIVFGSSGAKNVPEGYPHADAWAQIVALLRQVNDLIGDRDINIAIEPLNSTESNIVITAAEGLKLAKEVNRPHIRLLVDFFHLSMEHEDLAILAEAKDYLQHMHIANPDGRVWPKAGDGGAYREFFSALKAAGYDGRVSVEGYSKDFEADAPEALRALRADAM